AEALRALILSQAYQNTDAPELNQGLERALTKGSSTERAIARFGLAVRSESQARQLLKSRAPAELEAAASVFWWHGEAYRRACVQRLAQLSSHPLSKQALALAPALSAPGP